MENKKKYIVQIIMILEEQKMEITIGKPRQ